MFTAFRLGAIMLRLFALLAADGTVPPDVADEQGRNSGPAQQLVVLLDALA